MPKMRKERAQSVTHISQKGLRPSVQALDSGGDRNVAQEAAKSVQNPLRRYLARCRVHQLNIGRRAPPARF